MQTIQLPKGHNMKTRRVVPVMYKKIKMTTLNFVK